jgi:mRNA-degrading endonuclease RelE of RelBE toxin-antitoxin system
MDIIYSPKFAREYKKFPKKIKEIAEQQEKRKALFYGGSYAFSKTINNLKVGHF